MKGRSFALAAAALGAALLMLAWIVAWQGDMLPVVAVSTIGGAITADLIHRAGRRRR